MGLQDLLKFTALLRVQEETSKLQKLIIEEKTLERRPIYRKSYLQPPSNQSRLKMLSYTLMSSHQDNNLKFSKNLSSKSSSGANEPRIHSFFSMFSLCLKTCEQKREVICPPLLKTNLHTLWGGHWIAAKDISLQKEGGGNRRHLIITHPELSVLAHVAHSKFIVTVGSACALGSTF